MKPLTIKRQKEIITANCKFGVQIGDVFMAYLEGKTVYDGLGDDPTKKWKGEARNLSMSQLKYSTDWNELMRVIKAIEAFDVSVFDYDTGSLAKFNQRRQDIIQLPITTRLPVVYSHVFVLCEWLYDIGKLNRPEETKFN